MITHAGVPTIREQRLLAAAQGGDEGAYRGLVEPFRRELHAHCYRMLGSVHDAEDALQDALLRAWRGLPRFQARSSLRAWLYRICTNTCLDLIARRPRRVLPIDHVGAADPHTPDDQPLVETAAWIEPYTDELEDGRAAPDAVYELRETVELAFVAALQHLPARQRAVLILRAVLGFSAKETAETLGTTVAGANGALARARAAVDERLPRESQQATLRTLGDERLRELVEGYTAALERGDVETLVALLTEDASWSMPPCHNWYRGRAAIAEFLRLGPLRERWRHLSTRVNGQAAVACYAWSPERQRFAGTVVDVLTVRGDRIADVTAFIGPETFPRLGLPAELPA
ncbi:sigma-70 family RNA polymerase sigma factor [Conexibacter woesei]|uniref:RNA polymerase, sigma-24 subunit, ECF subfamily n=1 Tax=Conexibacter woesei (strain DSM 14684 / CCUG 47730 / CIP 108061 / JCM 11494 / NBRC 100937 / ID131577) TaxID=469383 RepID=D3FE63_CONWI|nr:sigma-70 family RNA polymerase sigma factor [Conexibacter woesei]ADB51679.1 RNA polymerase, sigma-24 subunit, ECF subfamily [Conexibacter woesei DSM 14684]